MEKTPGPFVFVCMDILRSDFPLNKQKKKERIKRKGEKFSFFVSLFNLNENNIFVNKSKLFAEVIGGSVSYKTLNVLHNTNSYTNRQRCDIHIDRKMFGKHLNNVSQLLF